MPNFCFCPCCKSGYASDIKERKKKGVRMPSFFKPPLDPEIFELWKKSIPRADRELSQKDHICERHFKEEDIDRFMETKIFDGSIFRLQRHKPRLRTGAIPCIFPEALGHSSYGVKEVKNQKKKVRTSKTKPSSSSSPKQKKSRKTKTFCSEKEAKQKIDSPIQFGKENILFEGIVIHPASPSSPTSQPILFKERKENEVDIVLSNTENCLINPSESTFIQEDVKCELFIESNEADNSMISASLPFQSPMNEYESSSIDSPIGNDLIPDYSVSNKCETVLIESDVVLPKSVVEEQFSFNFLKININMVDTMNPWWKAHALDDFISFNRYMPDFTIERRIVITKDFAVKVFLKDRETTIGSDLQVISIDVISKLIFRVERSILCRNVDNKDRDCAGFLQGVLQCKKYNLCLNCVKWEKEQKKLLMRPVKIPNDLVELIRFNFDK